MRQGTWANTVVRWKINCVREAEHRQIDQIRSAQPAARSHGTIHNKNEETPSVRRTREKNEGFPSIKLAERSRKEMDPWRLQRLPAPKRCGSAEVVVKYRSRRCDFPFLPTLVAHFTADSVTDKRLSLVLPAPADPVSLDQSVLKVSRVQVLFGRLRICVFHDFPPFCVTPLHHRCTWVGVRLASQMYCSTMHRHQSLVPTCTVESEQHVLFHEAIPPNQGRFLSSRPACSGATCFAGRRPTVARSPTVRSPQDPTMLQNAWIRSFFFWNMWAAQQWPQFVEHLSLLRQTTPDPCLSGARAVKVEALHHQYLYPAEFHFVVRSTTRQDFQAALIAEQFCFL